MCGRGRYGQVPVLSPSSVVGVHNVSVAFDDLTDLDLNLD